MRDQVWLPLMRRSGSATLGESILRLASLAEAAHRLQAVKRDHPDEGFDGRADGSAPQDVVAVDLGGLGHTEVDR
ncbi:MAG: hypothetical protein Kow00105_14630 [Phycisphaeraceae bacterium]